MSIDAKPPRKIDASFPAWLAIGATILAAATRVINLSILPPPAWVDEIWFAARARDLTNGSAWVAHYGTDLASGTAGNAGGNAGLVYLTALARLVGIDSIISARAVTSIAGIMAVALAYACFKEIFRTDFRGRRLAAVLVAVGLCVLPSQIILSRVGMEPALLPPISLFVVWQTLVGLRRAGRSRLTHLSAAGLVIGLAQYNGPHSRFLIPLVGFILLESWIAKVRRAGWGGLRGSGRDLVAFLAPAVIVIIPLGLAFVAHPEYLTGRAVEVLDTQELPSNILKVLGAFHLGGDLNVRHNGRNTTMLDVVLGVGMLIGLVASILRIRTSTSRLFLVWLIVMMIPSAITAEAPNFGRMIGAAVPAVALGIMGWRWVFTDPLVRQRSPRAARVAAGVVLAAFCISYNLMRVFNFWAQDKTLDDAFTARAVEVGSDLVERAEAGENVYVDRRPEQLDVAAFDYLFTNTPIRRVDLRQCLPLRQPGDVGTVYLAYANDQGSYPYLRNYYSESTRPEPVDLGWQGDFFSIDIQASDLKFVFPSVMPPARVSPGVNVVFSNAEEYDVTVIFELGFEVIEKPDRAWHYFVHVQPTGVDGLPPIAQSDGLACGDLYPPHLWLPHEVIRLPPIHIELPVDLQPGEYDVVFGWYDAVTGERAPMLIAERPLPDNRAILFSFDIP